MRSHDQAHLCWPKVTLSLASCLWLRLCPRGELLLIDVLAANQRRAWVIWLRLLRCSLEPWWLDGRLRSKHTCSGTLQISTESSFFRCLSQWCTRVADEYDRVPAVKFWQPKAGPRVRELGQSKRGQVQGPLERVEEGLCADR